MSDSVSFSARFLSQTAEIASSLDANDIESLVREIAAVKESRGRVFFLGSGGGAGHASHATCDFRKILGIESYCVTDNASELTARVNDESWGAAYRSWLTVSNLSNTDLLFFFSVGGGSHDPSVSENLCNAADYGKEMGAKIAGVFGRDGGYLRKLSDASVVVPVVDRTLVTPHTEGFQAVLWHLVVSHPLLSPQSPHWEKLAT